MSDVTLADVQRAFADKLRKCQKDPKEFLDILGIKLWDKQLDILDSVWKYRQTWVPSCNAAGKTFVAAVIALAWMYCNKLTPDGTIVAVFGQKFEKLRDGFWSEFQRLHHGVDARFQDTVTLGGDLRTHKFYPSIGQFPKSFAGIYGAKKENVENVQGTHARNLLIIVEEGSGLEDEVLEALESCATGENSRILVIGNPIKLSGPFYERCNDPRNKELAKKKLRNVIQISALDTPNYKEGKEIFPGMAGRGWVEEEKAKWGEHSAYYQARVLGQFPQSAENSVFPLEAIEAACERADAMEITSDDGDRVAAMDIARDGGDMSVVLGMAGDVVDHIQSKHTPNTIDAAEWFHRLWHDWGGGGAAIDENGLGGGPYDYLKINYREMHTRGFVSQRSTSRRHKERFFNLKAEMAWDLRERMIDGNYAIRKGLHRDKLKRDLMGYLWEVDRSTGKIKIIDPPKSPDYGDAAIMAHWRQEGAHASQISVEVGHRVPIGSRSKEF